MSMSDNALLTLVRPTLFAANRTPSRPHDGFLEVDIYLSTAIQEMDEMERKERKCRRGARS